MFLGKATATLYPREMTPKRSETVSFRISPEGKKYMYQIAEYTGLSQSGVFEMMLRDYARYIGIIKDGSKMPEWPGPRKKK